MNPKLVVAAAVLALHGCASAPPHSPSRGPGLVPVEATGDYVHPGSGLVFPAQVEQYRRASLFRGSANTQHLTVGYAGGPPECLAAITMLVDAASGTMEDAYARATAEVREAFANAILEREATHPQNASRFADYAVEDRRLQLLVQEPKPGWTLKSRVIYPAKCVETPMQVGGFFTQFDARQRGPR
jgi:hypothetical protein